MRWPQQREEKKGNQCLLGGKIDSKKKTVKEKKGGER